MTAPDDVLLPCPFCGGEGLVTQNQSLRSVWRVSCKNCDAGPYGSIGREAAIEKWNARAAHAYLSGEVRELVEADRGYDETRHRLEMLMCADARIKEARERFEAAKARRAAALAKHTHQEKP